MAKIFVKKQGSLLIEGRNGEMEAIDSFEAPIIKPGDRTSCDCGVHCCGDTQVIQYVTSAGNKRTMNLDAIWDLVPVNDKTGI
tara:strand:- start:159 stop:407 length:249 start_codon:yes stop_codon:yes gene_type:complete